VSFPLSIGQDFSAGDQVFGFAPTVAHAEYEDVSVKELARKPESIDFVTAASVPRAGRTAWQMMTNKAKVSKGW